MKKVLITSALSLTFLTGCAGQVKPHKIQATDGSSLEVATTFALTDMNNNRYADSKLRVVEPVHSGTGMGLAIVSAVLGGGIRTGDFDKENYKGSSIDAMPEPTALYFGPKAEHKIQDWLGKNGGGYAYTQPLKIAAAQWSLVYTDMSATNSNYDLTYRVQFYKRPEGGNLLSAFVMAECAPTRVAAPLSDWKANNYAKVTQETQKMMDACLLELDNQLPRLLKK
ncbi:hypothetical protein QQF21_21720 [Lelliottia sp. V89_10]|uniref:hypothetical protein n=1 Tax=Lelliottia wanjuensis TaxID=3050585 RepID=UPI00249DE05D|nr:MULTISPECIES: hypothetical protein [unclassified Lelliottia]MDI3360581.1 hypothetical protein [Lelliottia sp. V89_13]MDK9550999.1 hypothetical protein [Lelliottia sp. V89_5]MDK9598242.1 hypothetical protein [Lelliottia sp. V89_10]